jgi:hypothetical protein
VSLCVYFAAMLRSSEEQEQKATTVEVILESIWTEMFSSEQNVCYIYYHSIHFSKL